MKAQMREANRLGARRVVMVGSDELAARAAVVRSMADSTQEAVSFDELLDRLTT